MRFDSLGDGARAAETRTAIVRRLLDPTFGFVVWALHLLIVYGSTAVACQLGLGAQTVNLRSNVLISLVAITFVAAAIVAAHGVKRYRDRRQVNERGFLARLAVADDAVAVLAILWQLMPITMVPLCR
jgi:hypothetical protein